MRGKYAKKKKSGSLWPVFILILLVLAVFAVLGILASRDQDDMPLPSDPAETAAPSVETIPTETEPPFTFEQEEEGITGFTLADGLTITRYGKYIGLYMEDGSDEIVTNVMMILVENISDKAIQYAKITVTGPAGDAVFNLTTLLPGQSMVVLEAERKPYSDADEYTEAKLDNLALFQEIPTTMSDKLEIQPLKGGFNITNISGEDITGEIKIYFKDVAAGVYYGGITYLCRIEGGMKAGEIRQIMSSNFTEDGSEVVFVTIAK